MRKSLFLLFVFCVVVSFLSCAKKEEKVVALIGGEKLTAEEFDQKLKKRVKQMPATREEELNLRKNVLEGFIQEKFLAEAALEMKRDTMESFVKVVKDQEERLLLQELYTIEVIDKSVPTDRELQEFYKKQGEEIHARHILVKNEEKADEIYRRLKEGADFEQVAKQESQDMATKDKGGDLGFFQWGKMVGPFQETAFKLKPQEISRPVKSGFGWHIIKVEERREVEQAEYEKIKDRLTTTLQSYKQQELSYTFIEDMKRKSGFEPNPSALRVLMDKGEQKEDTLATKRPQGAEFDPAKFSPEEKELTLASFKGGEIKIAEFLENYETLPPFRRPGLDEQLIGDLVYQMSLKPILKNEARDKKLDRAQGYLNSLKDFKEMTLADGYKYEILLKDVSATEDETKDYYEKNKDLYLEPAQVKLREVMLKSEEEAKEVLQELKKNEDWNTQAKKTLRSHVKHRGGELGFVNEKIYPHVFDYAWNHMKVGEIGGPVHIKDSRYGAGYSVIELLDKKYSYQKPSKEVRADVERRVIGEKKLQILKEWTDQMKEKKGVKIFEDVLVSTLESKEQEKR